MLRELGIATVAIVSGVLAILAAILFVSHSLDLAIAAVMANVMFVYAACRVFLHTDKRQQAFRGILVLWSLATLLAVIALSEETWWK